MVLYDLYLFLLPYINKQYPVIFLQSAPILEWAEKQPV